MKSKDIKVSVITPYYKGINTIFDTINSVFDSKELCQEIKLEYIVIIDSMEDKVEITSKLKEKYGQLIKVIENDINIGVAESRNKAIKYAKYDYVLFLDQDDIIEKQYFKLMKKGMENNSDLIICNSYVVNIRNDKKVKMYNKKPNLTFEDFLKGNKILTPGQVLFSKRISKVNNLYTGCSKEFKGADDWASYLNIFINFNNVSVFYVREPIFNYNLHENNYSNNWKELNMSAVKTAEFFLDKVGDREKKILKKQIDFLIFENEFKDEDYKIKLADLNKIIKYYNYNIFDYNRIAHFLNKKLIGFYR